MRNHLRDTPSASTQRHGIVFLTPGFPADESDTTCLPAMQNYVAALAAQRPDLAVHVVAFQYPFRRGVYRWHGVTVHALAGKNRTGVRRLPTWVRAVRAFSGIRRSVDVRAMHSFWLTECTRVGQWLERTFDVPLVANICGQDAQASNQYLRRLDLERLTVAAGSQFVADVFATSGHGAVAQVIPFGLDTEHLKGVDPPAKRTTDLIGVGSLIPLKNYAAFVDVVAAMRDEFPGLRATIVGEGTERAALETRIARDGLEDNVELAGRLPREEVFRRMLGARVLLHPSHYECQGYVFLEALFAGLGVVCFDVGYTGSGDHVARCSSQDELVEACRRMLRESGPRESHEVPTVADTVRAFEALYGV